MLNGINGLYPIVDEIDLPAALNFFFDSLLDDVGGVRRNGGDNGETIRRRGLNYGNVADARQGQVQGPRDRCGGQTQHIHFAPQLLKFFFVGYTKPLLFVNDDQSEIFELDVFGQKPMGANNDIYLAQLQLGYHLVLFTLRLEPAEGGHPRTEGLQALGEGLVLLFH